MQPIPSIRLRGAVALLAGTAIGMAYHPAAAQVSTGGWAFDLAAYGWFTAMTGPSAPARYGRRWTTTWIVTV